eukprot:TRINITY_DN25706_c0_g1_i2.p1 TRINITY_DN25706_c0_g1~~TRINITY_DN25706_c0_g1_i2.p1  ORF type:complete len:176 (+),score=42.59 TRINITY_DN25706_c0_g1_i2:91-618(+)
MQARESAESMSWIRYVQKEQQAGRIVDAWAASAAALHAVAARATMAESQLWEGGRDPRAAAGREAVEEAAAQMAPASTLAKRKPEPEPAVTTAALRSSSDVKPGQMTTDSSSIAECFQEALRAFKEAEGALSGAMPELRAPKTRQVPRSIRTGDSSDNDLMSPAPILTPGVHLTV